jgi:hypothetical protein
MMNKKMFTLKQQDKDCYSYCKYGNAALDTTKGLIDCAVDLFLQDLTPMLVPHNLDGNLLTKKCKVTMQH